MKKWIIGAAAMLAFVACFSPEQLGPEEKTDYAVLQQSYAAAQQAVEDAATPGEKAEAEAALDAAEKDLAEFEAKVVRNKLGPFMSTLYALPVVGPYLGAMGPGILGLIPLFSRRGRKHYGKAVAQLNPFSKEGAGEKGSFGTNISPVQAVLSILRAFGSLHSSKESEAAADAS